MSVYEYMDLYIQIYSACLWPHSPNLLLLYPQKQRGLRCFLPAWPTTLPPNYIADTVFAFCTYNDQGPEHCGNLGTTTPEINIYSNNTVFHSDAQIRINDNPIPRDLHTIPLSLLFCYAKMFWKSKEIITSQNCIFLFPSNNTHLLLNQS